MFKLESSSRLTPVAKNSDNQLGEVIQKEKNFRSLSPFEQKMSEIDNDVKNILNKDNEFKTKGNFRFKKYKKPSNNLRFFEDKFIALNRNAQVKLMRSESSRKNLKTPSNLENFINKNVKVCRANSQLNRKKYALTKLLGKHKNPFFPTVPRV